MLLTFGNICTAAVVCYAADRNELRSRVIQWLQTEVVPDGWFVKGSNFSDILLKYFKVGFFSLAAPKDSEMTLSVHTSLPVPFNIILCLQLSPISHVTDMSGMSADSYESV